MKLNLINNIIIVLILFTVGCSTTQKVDFRPSPKVYSSATENEFASIERSDFNYPLIPLKKIENEQFVKKEKIEPTIIKKIAKNQEKLQEINQNLAFFCMKKRKDVNFSNEDKCHSFTAKVLNDCEKMHPALNSAMLRCIKEHLKKGVK